MAVRVELGGKAWGEGVWRPRARVCVLCLWLHDEAENVTCAMVGGWLFHPSFLGGSRWTKLTSICQRACWEPSSPNLAEFHSVPSFSCYPEGHTNKFWKVQWCKLEPLWPYLLTMQPASVVCTVGKRMSPQRCVMHSLCSWQTVRHETAAPNVKQRLFAVSLYVSPVVNTPSATNWCALPVLLQQLI